jgi:hypothetical protein
MLRRTSSGKLETAWIGDLRSKSFVPVQFTPAADNRPHLKQWNESPETLSYDVQVRDVLRRLDENGNGKLDRREARKDPVLWEDFARIDQSGPDGGDNQWARDEIVRWCRVTRAGEVSLGQLWELASKALRLLPGETRLIAWTEEKLPGVVIRPVAAQEVRRTMVLIHLQSGELPTPLPDVNLLALSKCNRKTRRIWTACCNRCLRQPKDNRVQHRPWRRRLQL